MGKRYVAALAPWGILCLSMLSASSRALAEEAVAPPPVLWQTVENPSPAEPGDRLIAEAVHKLSNQDFDRFMNKVGSMVEKVAQGPSHGNGRAKPAPGASAADADRAPTTVDAQGNTGLDDLDAHPIQTSDDFFNRPIPE